SGSYWSGGISARGFASSGGAWRDRRSRRLQQDDRLGRIYRSSVIPCITYNALRPLPFSWQKSATINFNSSNGHGSPVTEANRCVGSLPHDRKWRTAERDNTSWEIGEAGERNKVCCLQLSILAQLMQKRRRMHFR